MVDVPPEEVSAGRDAPGEGERGGVVYLARLPAGPVTVLSGASAVLYRALVAPAGDLVGQVARDLGVPVADVDLEAIHDFADELCAAGLLRRRDDA